MTVGSAGDAKSAGSWATVAVAAVVVLFAAGLPLADALLGARRRGLPAGTQLVLAVADDRAIVAGAPQARVIRFVPATGWAELDESDPSSGSVAITRGGIVVEVLASSGDGVDCAANLEGVDAQLSELDASGRLSDAQTFTTAAGQVGVAASFVGTRVEGLTFVVCDGETAATAVASGPVGALQGDRSEPVVTMAESIEIS